MNWEEVETHLREQILVQPRGFQRALAKRLEVVPASVAQFVTGHRRIPPGHITTILDALDLELTVQPKQG